MYRFIIVSIILTFSIISIILVYANDSSFESADKDKNGSVNQEEFRSFLKIYSDTKTEQPLKQTVKQTEFTLNDTDKDGSISQQEFLNFLSARTVLQPASPQDQWSNFEKADFNRDGFLSPEELKMYRKKGTDNTAYRTVNNMINNIVNNTVSINNAVSVNNTVSENNITSINDPVFEYKGPMNMVTNKIGTKIFLIHYDAGEIAVIDTEKNEAVQTFPVGKEPTGIMLSPDEKIIYVTFGSYHGQLSALDAESGNVLQTVSAGHTPTAPVVTPDGTKLFLCNRFNNNIAEYELPVLKFVKHINVVREPRAAVITKDGKKIIVLNSLPNDPNCFPDHSEKALNVAAEVSVIDISSGATKNLRLPNGSCNLRGVCLSADGRYVYLTHLISHFWNGTEKLDGGQMNVNAMSILDTTQFDNEQNGNGYVNTILLDDPQLGAANPWGITTSSDDKQIFVAISGTNELIILDSELLHQKLALVKDASNDLTFTAGFKKRILFMGKGAREVIRVGRFVYIGLYFNDLLIKFDPVLAETSSPAAQQIIVTGSPLILSQGRIGEIAWNDASLCYQQWQTCTSCHPDARMTGMNWDLLHDGSGNPKNTKSMVYSSETPPVMWLGDRFSARLCTRTGFTFIMFAPALNEPCDCIDVFVRDLQPLPSPYLVNGRLSERAERGKKIFENPNIGCLFCHSGPYFTDTKMYDVKTQVPLYESRGKFDTPTLIEVWRTAPYLHDGRYVNMKDVFKLGKHGDVKGTVDQLTEEQLDDLVEYLLSL
ncbi:MAG: EF-hand domain-containing protein [Planctomycetaceae bacterium]|jgi:DNA-binding beta-propeller fold protein YncE|nr:EF-hand domain-containing protein [Planctomycetaceae bacterium]